jgi:UbiD family decarboxylase
MAFADLREWIDVLKQKNELMTINASVDPYLELGAICRYFIDHGPNKALLFNNVKGYSIPVLANAFSTRQRLNLALGIKDEKLREQFILEHWNKSIEPVLVNEAVCQENVYLDENVDLNRFPIPWHNVDDGGRYISFGVLVTKDPESGIHNLSYARVQIKSNNKGGIMVTPNKHARRNMEKYWSRGENTPVSIFIGADPILKLAAAASPPYDVSEYNLAGALRGEAVKVIRSITNDLLVPADAEIVIEGEIPPDVLETEGPFGEFTGYYGPAGEREVLLVRAITHRNQPIYQTLYTGMPICDNHVMQELLRSAKVWERVKQVVPNVKAVYCPPQAGNGFTVWISMKKKHDGEPKLAMMAAWTAFEYVKHVFVVDEDVNIYDSKVREWVVATRVQADHDVLIIPGMVGMALDPSAQGRVGDPVRLGIFERARNHKAVMGIDCTKPLGVPFEKVVEVPDRLIEQVKQRLPELLGQ